jgi:hypothetical protein
MPYLTIDKYQPVAVADDIYTDVDLITDRDDNDPARASIGVFANGAWTPLSVRESCDLMVKLAYATAHVAKFNHQAQERFVATGTHIADAVIGTPVQRELEKQATEYFDDAHKRAVEKAEMENRALRGGLMRDALADARNEVAAEMRALVEAVSCDDDDERAAILADLDLREILADV